MATITDRCVLTYLAFRNQYLKKPSRVYLSSFGSFPKLKLSAMGIQRPIVPIFANASFSKRPVTMMKAYKDERYSSRISSQEERPEWFWRILSCVPYLISLKMSEIGFYMKPFLEQHGGAIGETILNLIPGPANKSQHDLYKVYCLLGIAWMAKNRDLLPHYVWFHMIMGMLLETTMQIIWRTSEFFPLINLNGRLAMYHHVVIGF